MPGTLLLWLSWVVALAALMVAHLALLLAVVRTKSLSPTWRWLALVPVVLPVAGWRAGKRGAVVTWTVLLVLYVALRGLEAAVS